MGGEYDGSRALCCASSRRAQASPPVGIGLWRYPIGLVALIFAAGPLAAEIVSVSVFGLFRPQELIVSPAMGGRLMIESAGDSRTLEGGQNLRLAREGESARISIAGANSFAAFISAKPSSAAGRFVLEAPGKLRREFSGELRVRIREGALEAAVDMDLETAVAAVVAAEGGQLSLAALEAQAIAARSYLSASTGRHSGYQFCDTTHCQYLADAPPMESPAARAAAQTRGLVLAYRGRRFAPLYSRSCGGETHTPSDVGLLDGIFPYRRVRCPVCSRDRTSWEAKRPAGDVAPILAKPGDENARLEVGRRLGWSAVPSNRYEIVQEGDVVRIDGTGEGHGVGLCQRGATGLAREGWTLREILALYFPDSTLVELAVN